MNIALFILCTCSTLLLSSFFTFFFIFFFFVLGLYCAFAPLFILCCGCILGCCICYCLITLICSLRMWIVSVFLFSHPTNRTHVFYSLFPKTQPLEFIQLQLLGIRAIAFTIANFSQAAASSVALVYPFAPTGSHRIKPNDGCVLFSTVPAFFCLSEVP